MINEANIVLLSTTTVPPPENLLISGTCYKGGRGGRKEEKGAASIGSRWTLVDPPTKKTRGGHKSFGSTVAKVLRRFHHDWGSGDRGWEKGSEEWGLGTDAR